jgi:AraC-like DNA-binding protein
MPDRVLHEITPLMGRDALYIADRRKKEFAYPIHNHDVYELNFVEHAPGVRRVVGDSSEVIGDYDLVLITSPELEHVWEQGECTSQNVREVTIQFRFGLDESDEIFLKTPFQSIRHMLEQARKGLAFPLPAIMKVYNLIDNLSIIEDRFEALMQFIRILHILSIQDGAHTLATSSYAKVKIEDDSRRVLKVKNFINENYMYEIKLETLADLANMSQSAFSRFFKLHTGRTLSDYIIDIRLSFATRKLLDTQDSVANISFDCGYNNLSNFNRIFKRKKGCSPTEFREKYRKTKIIV